MSTAAHAATPASDPRRRELARALAVASALTLVVGQVGLWRRIEPVATWSYALSWWSAIFLIDAVLYLRRGTSIALSRPVAFLGLAYWSGVFWLLHECANFRLSNWYYVGIPADWFTRSVGVFLSFATVLPGVLEVHALLSRAERRGAPARELGSSGPTPKLTVRPRVRAALLLLGLGCLLLPLAFPRQAFPLIWGAGFFLLEPWLVTRDPRSLLSRFAIGERRPLLRMLLAGLVCGLMWETWNWRSPAKWIYTVPFFEDTKLFEMPYLGFVGFVPFALSCHSFARALVLLRLLPEWDPEAPPTRTSLRRALAAAAPALVFSAAAIAGVNRFTVRATRPMVRDIRGLPPRLAEQLSGAGVRYLEDFLRAAVAGTPPLDRQHVSPHELGRWVEDVRLMRIKGLGARGLAWLDGAGVQTVAHLASLDPDELLREMLHTRKGPPPVPSRAEVRVWILGARIAPP